MSSPTARAQLLRRGVWLAGASVAIALTEAGVGIASGVAAGSVALLGFGIDSCIEVVSAVIVGRRLWLEWRRHQERDAEAIELRARRIAGVLLLLLAGYIIVDSSRRLLGFGEQARQSIPGIVLTACTLVLMPVLGRAKLSTARALGSGALRADAYETITCAWLSAATLLGLALNAMFGWRWADPVAGLLLVPLIVREGLEGLRGECTCHDA